MKMRSARIAVLACTFAALPLPAPAQRTSQSVRIVRTAGACPASIAVAVTTKQYAGGGMFDYVAQTTPAAYVAELVSATPQHVVFDAQLVPAYASCEGAGTADEYRFNLHKGKLTFTLSPGKGPDNVYPGLIDVGIVKGMPHVSLAVPD